MTENEAKRPKFAIVGGGRNAGRTLKAHIELLEALEAYRAIGTVEEIQQKLKNMSLVIDTDRDLLDRYIAIGTIEEFKALKEKNVAKKPYQDKHLQHTYFCSCCGYTLAESVADDCCLEEEMAGWCPNCGQKLDWIE